MLPAHLSQARESRPVFGPGGRLSPFEALSDSARRHRDRYVGEGGAR
jgi:hypothetical protein